MLVNASPIVHAQLPTPEEIRTHVQAMPTSEEIVNRVLKANERAPHIASTDFVGKLRLRKSLSDPPDCVFEGAVKLEQGHQIVSINRRTAGLTCTVANQIIISRLFEGNESFVAFLSRFAFQVLGWKLVNNAQYYLVQGKARQPQASPKEMIGWVDFDRGLIIEATVAYAWGAVDIEQQYTLINGAWVLIYQYANIPRYQSTLELSYSNFR